MAHAGSSPERPVQSYEQVPPQGNGDGYGNYGNYGAYGKGGGMHANYHAYIPPREIGFGPGGRYSLREMQRLDYLGDIRGYADMHSRERQERQAHATYGGKGSKGKGGGKNPQPKWASRPERVDPWPLL